MANKIQIKRSTANASVTGLSNGELAFTQVSNTLWIGLPDGSGVARIAGVQSPGVLTANQALVANATGYIDQVKVANATLDKVTANGSQGTAGHLLATGGTGSNAYWLDPATLSTNPAGANTQIQYNDSGSFGASAGFTFNETTNNVTVANTLVVGTATVNSTFYTGQSNTALTANNSNNLNGKSESNLNVNSAVYIPANNGIVSNSSGVFVRAGTGVTVNATGVHIGQPVATTDAVTFQDLTVNGNTILGSDSSDRLTVNSLVSGNVIPAANITYHLGNNSLQWAQVHAQNVHGVVGYFDGNVQIGGDLLITGNLVTTNVQSVVVSDPMIYLAGNNYTSDLVDIGFAGNYFDGATERHTGLFRDASDSGIYKLFTGSEQELMGNNVVNTAAAGYTTAILETYLKSAGLNTNSSSVNITANSTVSVGIVANTLSLSTALAGTSGGTGLSSYTAEDILVANSSNGFRKLSLGATGYVLQSNGSAIVYDVLDGGTF